VGNGRLNRTAVEEYLGVLGAGRLHDFYALHPSIANELQEMVVQSSRFKIGATMGEECTHGYQVQCSSAWSTQSLPANHVSLASVPALSACLPSHSLPHPE
jgi:hypothetical protein